MSTIVGIFSTHADAEFALRELRAFSVQESDISYIYANASGSIVDDQTGEKVVSSTGTGLGAGAIIGAVLGFAVANGVLPGLGPLLVAGPLATALGFTGSAVATVSGAVTGAAAGGLIGALGGLGISDADAVRFQEYVQHGDVLVVVHGLALLVRDVLVKAHAREVQEYAV